MWFFVTTQWAFGASVTLHVGVHRQAGTLYEIAADGAAGQCTVLGMSRMVCPADGSVRFRWAGVDGFELLGDVELQPGDEGRAFVLPPDGSREAWRGKLVEPDLESIRSVFVRTGSNPIPIPSRPLFDDLIALTQHADWRIRREAITGLFPYVRHTASDPFPADAPTLIPVGTFERLASDPSKHVRRRAMQLLREMAPEDPRATEAQVVVDASRDDDDRRVRKLAMVVGKVQATGPMRDPLEAWQEALSRVSEEGPVGRAACNAIAQLHDHLPVGSVDPDRALGLVIQHHPEKAWRVWGAWKKEVPFHAGRLRYLLDGTYNLSMGVFREWAATHPEELAGVLSDWEPSLPHSRRFNVIKGWLVGKVDNPVLAAVLGWDDTLSGLPDPTTDE